MQKGLGRIPAHAAALVDLEIVAALVVTLVEVIDARNARLSGGIAKGVQHVPAQALALDTPGAVATVKTRGARVMVLDIAKQRQDLVPGPTGVTHGRPAVVVGRLAP